MATVSASKYALKRAEKELNQTKVVLRRLPPDYTEEDVLALIKSDRPGYTPPDYTSFYFVPASTHLSSSFPAYSRAYLEIPNFDDIRNLRDTFDGLQLESKTDKGPATTKFRMIVEFAPYQGSVLQRTKPDARSSTIEQDPDYKTFLKEYEKEITYLPSVDISYLDQIKHIAEVQPTPLVDYIKERKTARRTGGGRNKILYASGGGKKKKTKVIEVKEKPSTSKPSKDKQWKDKGSGYDKKGPGSQDRGSGQEWKGSGHQDKGSSHEKKIKTTDAPNKTEDAPTIGGGPSRKKVDDFKSKERPDQAFYSPRSKRGGGGGGSEEKRTERTSKSEERRGGRSEETRRSVRSESDRSGFSEDRRSGRSDDRRGGGGGRRGGESSYDKGSRGKPHDKRTGSGGWYRDPHYNKHGGKQQSSGYHSNENYYHFQDDDEPLDGCHGDGGRRDDYQERDDRRYHGHRRNYDDGKKSSYSSSSSRH